MTTLTTPGDQRNSRARPVGCSDVLTLTTLIGENTKTVDISHLSGQVIALEYIAPDLATDTTFTISFLTKNGSVLHTTGALADNKAVATLLNTLTDAIYIAPDSKLKITFTTAQVAAFEVLLHVK